MTTRTRLFGRTPAVLALFLAVAGGARPAPALAQEEAQDTSRVTITGRVVDALTRDPLPGTMVELQAFRLTIRTDEAGQFEVTGIRRGIYRLRLSRPGYESIEGNFTVDGPGEFTLTLTPMDAPEELPPGRLIGRVVDGESGRPISGAGVRAPDLFMGVLTNNDGRFELLTVPPGQHAIEFSYLGYATRLDTISVVSGSTSDARVQMRVEAIDLDPIDVTVERRLEVLEDVGFYQRRSDGFGVFVDRDMIEQWNPPETTDLFTRFNGVTVMPSAYNPLMRVVLLRGGLRDLDPNGTPCSPNVYIDGTITHRQGYQPLVMEDIINPSAIAGIEIYPSSTGVPMQYGGINASCGVIVIWTRRR